METVIVAFENSKTAWRVKEILEGGGVASCVVCRSADQVRRTLHKLHVPAVVCGYKLGDQTAELLFDDLSLSCAMLVLASQNLLELMQNDDIFRLPTPVSRGDLAQNRNSRRDKAVSRRQSGARLPPFLSERGTDYDNTGAPAGALPPGI